MHLYTIPESSPREDKALADLVNAGFNQQQLYRASYTFYRIYLEEKLIASQKEVIVQMGLFKGMKLYPDSRGSSLLPKWQGTYEAELTAALQTYGSKCNTFINIGCAEGYYLTGIAMWLGIDCYGFDIAENSDQLISTVTSMNKVSSLVNFVTSIEEAFSKAKENRNGKSIPSR